jgi:hypothetical protein
MLFQVVDERGQELALMGEKRDEEPVLAPYCPAPPGLSRSFRCEGRTASSSLVLPKWSFAPSFACAEKSRMPTLTSGFQTPLEELISTRCHKVFEKPRQRAGE